MEVYRVAAAKYGKDLTGSGARLYGGRWNQKGTAMIYTSKSRALAALEFLVHLPLSLAPPGLKIVSLQIPDETAIEEIPLSELPASWRTLPAPPRLAELGSAWLKTNKTLLLRVPSVIIEKEFNILINPGHPDIKLVTLGKIEDFKFDDRLLREKNSPAGGPVLAGARKPPSSDLSRAFTMTKDPTAVSFRNSVLLHFCQ